MPFPARVFKVFLASPSDVASERQTAALAINTFNGLHGEELGILLLPIGWETHAFPVTGARAQETINKELLDQCDLLIAIFWSKLGTETGDSESGTVEEVRKHVSGGKQAMIYFSAQPVIQTDETVAEYPRLKKFKDECYEMGLVETFVDKSDFHEKLTRQILQLARSRLVSDVPAETDTADAGSVTAFGPALPQSIAEQLRDSAKLLLKEAALDPHGVIVVFNTMDGTHIQSNSKDFVNPSAGPRELAAWQDALVQLEDNELMASEGVKREVFKLTSLGYQVADLI